MTARLFSATSLTSEAVESPSLPLEGVHDIHGRDGLPASVLSVGHSVADHVLKKDLENASGLLVDQPADTLHAATASQAPDRRLRDALDVVAEHLPVPLRSALAQPLSALAAPRHFLRRRFGVWMMRKREIEGFLRIAVRFGERSVGFYRIGDFGFGGLKLWRGWIWSVGFCADRRCGDAIRVARCDVVITVDKA